EGLLAIGEHREDQHEQREDRERPGWHVTEVMWKDESRAALQGRARRRIRDDMSEQRCAPEIAIAPQSRADALFGREDVDKCSGPASVVLDWLGRRVGGLGPGLTCYSADAAGCLRIDLSAGPRFLWHPPALPV